MGVPAVGKRTGPAARRRVSVRLRRLGLEGGPGERRGRGRGWQSRQRGSPSRSGPTSDRRSGWPRGGGRFRGSRRWRRHGGPRCLTTAFRGGRLGGRGGGERGGGETGGVGGATPVDGTPGLRLAG